MDFNTVIYSTDIKSEDPCQEDLTLKNEKNFAKSFIDFKVKSEPNPENEDSLQDEEIQMNDEFEEIISSLKGDVLSMPSHGENQEKVHAPICNLKVKHENVNLHAVLSYKQKMSSLSTGIPYNFPLKIP